jgi:acyl-CoA synthetase (AMP-forming)/AMP-acid ligase II
MHTALLLEMAAEAQADRIAFGGRHGGVSFAELLARTRGAAGWLQAMEGETIAFVGVNSPALPTALFASAWLEKPFTPMNYRLSDSELARLVARTAPSVAIVDDDMAGRLPEMQGVTRVTTSAFVRACAAPEHQDAAPFPIEPDVAIRLFTSGTTGEPKVALLRHRHLAAYVINAVDFASAEDDEAALVSVPPYHIAGISAILTGVYAGRRTVYLPAFTPEAWVETAATERVTQALVVPTMLGRILDVLSQTGERLPALRSLAYGGGRMPLPVIERALTLLPHVSFANAYGLTETSSTIAVLTPEDHREAIASSDEAVRRRLGSVGKPLATVAIEIRGPEGEVLPAGERGEVFVSGEQVAGEYLSHKVIDEAGWFATKDGGWLDEDGYLFIEGRLDDVIVRGGENISPGEIEDVLRSHPGVADVAVLGLPDEEWGEQVVAIVVPRGPQPTETDLAAWVQARLRSVKTPQTWRFREALPYTDTGKLLRRVLKAELG